jgi:hypothetical protein
MNAGNTMLQFSALFPTIAVAFVLFCKVAIVISHLTPISFVMSVSLSTCISVGPTGQISMKLDSGEFYENLSRRPKFGKIRQK